MNETSLLFVLGVGFVLGLKHATDPDHIVAVTTFVGKERSLGRACTIGLCWGLGHTLALSLAGFLVIGLRIPMSRWLAERLELAVAAMLVILGARLIASVHTKWHEDHDHFDWTQCGLKPILVGIVHGAAGSAALTLLVISTISSPAHGVLYIMIFGLGSMIGMLAISVLIACPVQWAGERAGAAIRPIQTSAGVLSCLCGLYLATSILRTLH
ncbi:MAG TPA: urease accessory protein UreH [Terriglobia bacterium]|nr:urease accessory protein UreH [Terriglobia bacterium]